jgi:hypothetical protein
LGLDALILIAILVISQRSVLKERRNVKDRDNKMTTTQLITAAENEDVFANIMTTLVELAKHEGDFMLHDAICRAEIDIDEDKFYSMIGGHRQSAAQCPLTQALRGYHK